MRMTLCLIAVLFVSACTKPKSATPASAPESGAARARYTEVSTTGAVTEIAFDGVITRLRVNGVLYQLTYFTAYTGGNFADIKVGTVVSIVGNSSFFGIGVTRLTIYTDPLGVVDGIAGNQIFGWAADPKTSASIDVHVYCDGPAGTGTFAGIVNAQEGRGDVNQALGLGGNHGFHFTIPQNLSGTPHDFYLYAINSSSGAINPQLGKSPIHFAGVPATPTPVPPAIGGGGGGPPVAAPNPHTFDAVVTTAYVDILGRNPDPQGLANATGQMAKGMTLAQMRGGLAGTPEARNAMDGVYRAILDRPADAGAVTRIIANWTVGGTLSDLRRTLANCDELRGYVNQAYQRYLGRPADAAAMARITSGLSVGGSLADLRASLAASDEARGNRYYREIAGRSLASTPTAVSYGGSVFLFAVRTDGTVVMNTKGPNGTDGWVGYWSLGSATVMKDGLSAVVHGGVLHLFARGLDNQVYVNVLDPAGWRGWSLVSPGALRGRPSAVSVNDILHVFATGTDGQVYVDVLDRGGWRGWALTTPGTISGSPSAVAANGTLHVFVRGLDSRLYDDVLDPAGWRGYSQVSPGTISASPAAAVDGSGNIRVIVRGSDAQAWQICLVGGAWTGYGLVTSGTFDFEPAVMTDPYGGVLAFVHGSAPSDEIYFSRLY